MNPQDIHFLAAFEAGTLHPFSHRDHLHVAWLYLRRDGWDMGLAHVREGIQHFATAHDLHTLYHETITRFWVTVVNHALNQSPEIDDFDVFIAQYDHLLDKNILTQHYSDAVIKSEHARREWVAPDLLPLPTVQ